MANRVLIYGVTGSGKTALAAKVAAATGLPWHSVDDLTWNRAGLLCRLRNSGAG